MTKAFSPRRPPRGGWLALAFALGLLLSVGPPVARAQQDAGTAKDEGKAKGKDGPKGTDEAKGKAKADPPTKAVEEEKQDSVSDPDAPDRYEDPNADAALENKFPELPQVKSTAEDKTLINQLARGQGQLDPAAIDRFVRSRAAGLTKRVDINALMDPAAKVGNAKGLEEAARDLMAPLLVTPSIASNPFRREYVKKLIEVFQPIWSGHLHSRTMAMIVLSRSGDPQAVPTFAAQLSKPKQLAIVKLLAAVGIANMTQNGRKTIDDAAATPAAKALSDFLKTEPNTFWPAQFRALEALGSLRVATEQPLQSKAEFADTALAFAADSKAAPDVRAWASWTLGMFRIPNSVKSYNFPLVANVIGGAAADIATKLAALPDSAQQKMLSMANLLVQLHLGLAGDPEIRDSGLKKANHNAAAAAQPYIGEVENRVRAVTKAGLELSNATKSQMKDRREALMALVADLRSFLAKPIPTGRSLYAGATPLPVPTQAKANDGGRQ